MSKVQSLEDPAERDKDIQRKRKMRSAAAAITIPECQNPQRRERALKDPELFLRGTYFARRYDRPFGKLHYAIIDALLEVAAHGGKQAIAAPRGRGKSELTKGMLCFLICAGMIRFPVPICQTTNHARGIYKDFRKKLMFSDELAADFPELCFPVRDLEGAPQRAGKQHIDGKPTRIEWTVDSLRLADVPAAYRGPIDYGGVRMEYRGLDSAIRGMNQESDRPDFIIIDDPETRESAKSETQIADRVNALEQDIAGLAGEDEELAQVMLTTIQNRYCISFQYTDPEIKPSWMGRRFGWVEKWPDEWAKPDGLWHEYIARRHKGQQAGDRYGKEATQFYLSNQDALHAGGELIADNYKAKVLPDGTQTVYSAWQVVFNAIADTSFEAFCTEYQNDPPEGEQIEAMQLTAAKVQSRIALTGQRETPTGTGFDTIGIDLGKYASHWCHTSWMESGCVGTIPDYGVVETVGLNAASDNKAIEHALISALEIWGEEIRDTIAPQLVLVDSGTWRDAAYEFCRRMGKPFFPAKGWDAGRFRMPKARTLEKLPYQECYASWQSDHGLWLYNMQGEHWKSWLQSRFLQRTYGENNERLDGSLALFDPAGDLKRHLSFSQHIVAEEEQFIPKEGKQLQRRWFVKNRNNHWLDATAMACCASGCLGVRLVQPENVQPKAARVKTKQEVNQVPSRFQRGGRPYLVSQR